MKREWTHKMATTTVTEVREVPEVEVTNNTSSQSDGAEENNSGFSKLRRRFKKDDSNTAKRPSDQRWRQQQIPACRPVFSATHVFFWFSVVGLIFIALGIAFTVILSDLREMEVDYTHCSPVSSSIGASFNSCAEYIICKRDCNSTIDNNCRNFLGFNLSDSCRQHPTCQCQVNITLDRPLRSTVHVYYGIKNYYQNHRRYLNSLDVEQLHGDLNKVPNDDCRPLVLDEDRNDSRIVPCGLIANSLFNDTFDVFQDIRNGTLYDINTTNIAWQSDRDTRFSTNYNPPNANNSVPPPNWPVDILDVPNILTNESLIVWFRVSAFPWFRKLYGRVMQNRAPVDLPASDYTVTITYSYPVTDFNGEKSVVLAELSWLGGRNLFLGSAYIITGAFLIVTGIVLLLLHLFCSKWKESDKNFLNRSY